MKSSHASKIRHANHSLLELGEKAAIPTFFTPNHVTHLTGRTMQGGHEGVRKYLDLVRRAFAEIQVEVEILVEAEDRVAWLRTIRAIHEAAFMGFPATGREIVWRDMVTSRFRDGLIDEEWVVTDLAERLLLARKGARRR